jgi:ribonucleoside-diphosphate reductase alpha chain
MDTIFLDDFSKEVWQSTYKHHNDTDIDNTLRRIAKAVSEAEKTQEDKKLWENRFYELLTGFKMCAGGRILANAGTGWSGTTLMNCFVGPKPKYDQDSIEGIYAVLLAQAKTLKSEGGWGMNFSFIRPRGSFIHGVGVESPGPVKFMEIFDVSSGVITAGSGKKSKKKEAKEKIRKGAMMGVLDIWHPSIEEFITAKLPYLDENGVQVKRLQKFNISVNCSNEFMDKLMILQQIKRTLSSKNLSHEDIEMLKKKEHEYDKWDLIFPNTQHPKYKEEWNGNMALWKSKGYDFVVVKTVSASALWESIMHSTYTRNDPGVLFLDRANETHCWNYGGLEAWIAATNPCGEQCLPFGFVCNLASMNLTQFVRPDGTFDFDRFCTYVSWAIRFLDNVNDVTDAPLPQYLEAIRQKRRVGLGVMGWGSMLYMMKIRFGSDKAEELKKKIMSQMVLIGITTSVELAIEKGMFVGCDPIKHSQHSFFKRVGVSDYVLEQMSKYGIRNSALFSCQPTGNTGILTNVVSGGIEPVFSPEYTRTVIVDACPDDLLPHISKYWEGEFMETDVFKWVKEGEDQILRGVFNGVTYKIDKSRGLTKEVQCQDYGVRWLRAKNEWDEKADWAATASSLTVDEHLRDMKGFSFWIDSSISKTVNLPNDYPYEDFQNLYLDAYHSGVLKGITTYRAGTMLTVLATNKKEIISKSTAPRRDKHMLGELHHFVIDGRKYYVAVGLYGDSKEPYEVFTGVNETRKEIYIPKSVKTGQIHKKCRGKYSFIGDDGEEYELTNGHSDDTADALSRMISCSLRHGSDISFIVHQLEKTKGPIVSFSKALARTLKKYIKDGTAVTGEECPSCKGKLVRQEGCCVCPSCGYSKCS